MHSACNADASRSSGLPLGSAIADSTGLEIGGSRPISHDSRSAVTRADAIFGTHTVTSFSIARFGTAAHSGNTDQWRIALTPTAVTGGYHLTIPADPGVAVSGYYMLSSMDVGGVPSVPATVKIS
jgi:Galactose oxidase-like, Early set domain